MKRRSFLTTSLVPTAIMAETGRNPADAAQKPGVLLSQPVTSLAGMSIRELRDRYRTDLFDEFLPFMEKHIIDHEYGGFMCNAGPDGTLISTVKRAGYEGRGIWVYSYLYNNLAREQRYLDVAVKSAALLLKNKPEGDIMWPSSFDREGNPSSPPGQSVNADMYIADGLIELAAASGDSAYRTQAKDVIMKCLRVYDSPDYGRDAGRGYVGKDAPETAGTRIMDDWMLFLRAATRMLVHGRDGDMEQLASRCVDTIMNNFYIPRFDLITEMLRHDHTPFDNDLGQLVNFGNDFQVIWHVMDEAQRTKNGGLFTTAADRLRRHAEVAWDDVYGGEFTVLRHIDENRWELGKTHYAQGETINGLMQVIEHTGAGWACDLASQVFSYSFDKFPLKQYGYPLWIVGSDRKVTFRENTTRIENFHQPRHLMLTLQSLDRLVERRGKTSGIFG